MKNIYFALLLSVVLAGGAFALGPVSLTPYAGGAAGSLGGGYDYGIQAMLSLPLVPEVGLEYEKMSCSVLGGINTDITRMGVVYKQGIIPFLPAMRFSLGSASMHGAANFSIGGHNFSFASGNISGTYFSAGLEMSLLSLNVSPRYIASTFDGQIVSELDVNLGLSF